MQDDVILDLPQSSRLPNVTVTTSRLTVRADTHLLAGVTAVKLELVRLREEQMFFWLGWALFASSFVFIFLVSNGFLALIRFSLWVPIGLIAGGWLIWSCRKSGQTTARIYLYKGSQRILCYEAWLGGDNHFILKRCGYKLGSKEINEALQEFSQRLNSVQDVARAIGKATGTATNEVA